VFGIFTGAGGAVAGAAGALARSLSGPFADYLLHTRGLTDPRLVSLWRTSLACLAAALVLPAAICGLAVITGRAGPAPAWGRSRLAALATAVGALPATVAEAALANALTAALLPHGGPGLWQRLAEPAGAGRDIALTVGALVSCGLLLVVAVLALARWATLWLLIGLAPVAMGFALLPGGDRLVATWWRLQLAAIFLPVGQAVALATYLAMFAGSRDPLVGCLAGIAVLVLVAKLPAWAAGIAVGVETRDFTARIRGAVLIRRGLPAPRPDREVP
jgi:hypothetical protein